jgi:transcriptional regulator with XRE-family HTH domain
VKQPAFARILADLMEEKSISPPRLADDAGLTRQAVHKLLNGSLPSWDTVQRLADALGVSPEVMRDRK